ncbi:ketoacyl-ACP synthase III [Mycobacterium sp. CBMA293]|uniref:beta-ketoacyl-ACP synthase III n=1 Tax=unclassified Mycolicibacterium TaxID=2636767 RepID=UPI001326CA7E|nr:MULTISPECIES: beta-ketoacyl-ACP synthase III [unclassified Mycolicibacterium]MUL45965.1 ketoacyl-ACP synthase III [Mycolicibacterium sp. CBMA 360]MUL95147.1 ketoacyl-ACP synthase III [Mycolicibacterium sp. CBMA 230]MUM33860.1 ketoacyl-ACP synthase III [Mycolicibacterium sp. CBMA 361]MUL60637.1 ketoacyl-ACP synthase III [Mycolicibacterium sp. CBMA 335]MUL72452.1 ketoacyl-ACP synthase III [Mycolicibacterium sp. CBMA 311]
MTQIHTRTGAQNVGLLSVAAYRPGRVVTNDEICQTIDSSDEWIYSRTGIKNRRFAGPDESAVTMACEAGRRACAAADLPGSEIDAVIVATSTNFRNTPPCGPQVATAIGAQGIPAFDIAAGCAGFGYSLGVAADMIRAGSARRILVVGSEKLSDAIDMTDRSSAFIFADGAAAVVVAPTEEQGIGPTVAGSDGEQSSAIVQDLSWIDYAENPSGPRPFLRMEGQTVFRWAAFQMVDVGRRAVEAAGLTVDDIDVFIPHQANGRINELLTKGLELKPETVIAQDIQDAGNTSAASIPLAMYTLLNNGEAKPGALALLIGYGAGLAYAAQVIRLPG